MISKHPRINMICRDPISSIRNYDKAVADDSTVYQLHHINELTFSSEELKKMNMYYHRPASELIFLTPKEHRRLHSSMDNEVERNRRKRISENNPGKSESTRLRRSISMKGKNTGPKSESTKRKISESLKALNLHWKNENGRRIHA